MDFFQRQDIARRNTKLLEVYFALAVTGTILSIYLGMAILFAYEGSAPPDGFTWSIFWNPQLLLMVSAGTILIIFCGSAYKISALSGGGYTVAEMLGGEPLGSQSADPDERKLLNVVEEMAIASGTPVPRVYLLRREQGINAFAAGHSTGDMVICVTGGSLRCLSRDELQGVIGHEFSHILNGDMRLNVRLMGIIFGILCLTIIGRILLQMRSERKNPLPLVGILLLIIGAIGVFFAKLIKSAVSRQREFLADAASVQFTRNPSGLATALKKVGANGSRIDDPNAEDASHFFFCNGLPESFFGWMSTHPPLEERIRALDPAWDGKFISFTEDSDSSRRGETNQGVAAPGIPPAMEGLMGAAILASGAIGSSGLSTQVGSPTPRHLEYAANILAALPEPLSNAAHDPTDAMALIYALLLSADEGRRSAQFQALQSDPFIAKETLRLLPFVEDLPSRARLPLVSLCITALRTLSPAQYDQFAQNIQAVINSRGESDLFTYALQKTVLRRLDACFHPAANKVPQYYGIQELLPDCAVVLSALACAGQSEAEEIAKAFRQGAQVLGAEANGLALDRSACDLNRIDAAMNRLNQASPQIKKAILNACAETVATDGIIDENEAELLRAISDSLDCPIPPFLMIA